MSHLGRHRNDLATWRAYAASAGQTVAELVAAWDGWQPAELDLGGGYAAPRDPNIWVHGGDIAKPLAPAAEDVVEALAVGLRAGIAGRVPLAGVTLEIEPGRALHADTGVHLTRVVNLKQQREPLAWRWVETDTTEMFLLDLLVEHCHFPVVAASRMAEPAGGARRRGRMLVRLRRAGAPGAPARRRARATRWPSSTPAPTRTAARPTSTRCRGPRSCSSAAGRPRSCAVPRRSRTCSRAMSCRSACGRERARHRSRRHHRGEPRGGAALLPRPARPAHDRRGRGFGARVGCHHGPQRRAHALCRARPGSRPAARGDRVPSARGEAARPEARATPAPRTWPCASTTSTRSTGDSSPPA